MLLDNLRKKIVADINESNLQIDMIYFVLKDILSEVTTLYNNTLEQERSAAAAQESQTEIQQDEGEVPADSEEEE